MEKIADFVNSLLVSPLTLLSITVLLYAILLTLHKKVSVLLLNPLLMSVVIIMVLLKVADIPYETYNDACEPLNFMLGLSVVALGYLIYQNIEVLEQYSTKILISTFIGSIVGGAVVIYLAKFFGCDQIIMLSLEPKTVTMPIALSLSKNIGGIPALTSFSVVITGVIGSIIGPNLLKIIGVNDPVAKGVALGASSHAIGTARALEIGVIEGAISGATIGIMGFITTLIVPVLNALFL